MKKLIFIFLLAFVFNTIWEELHSVFYVHYQSGEITQLILLRAAIVDAIIIALISIPFITSSYFQKRKWYALIIGIVISIALEKFALATGRWEYKDAMPIIPFIETGLTPTIQLGLLSYFILKIVNSKNRL